VIVIELKRGGILIMMGSLFKSGRSHHFWAAARRDSSVIFCREPLSYLSVLLAVSRENPPCARRTHSAQKYQINHHNQLCCPTGLPHWVFSRSARVPACTAPAIAKRSALLSGRLRRSKHQIRHHNHFCCATLLPSNISAQFLDNAGFRRHKPRNSGDRY
jgi:hypothetical protein